MRIAAKQLIAGRPALVIRSLLGMARDGIDAGGAARRLACKPVDAVATLNALVSLGYLEMTSEGHYTTTVSGNALAGARANAPLKRATAERLLADLVERARQVEGDARYLYLVKRLSVFGSYLDAEHERLGDIDLLLELEIREPDHDRRRALFDAHLDNAIASGRRFGSLLDRLAWPEREVRQFLRGRSKHLSFHSPADAIAANAPQRILHVRPGVASP